MKPTASISNTSTGTVELFIDLGNKFSGNQYFGFYGKTPEDCIKMFEEFLKALDNIMEIVDDRE